MSNQKPATSYQKKILVTGNWYLVTSPSFFYLSKITAAPCPPPTHSETRPVLRL